MSRKAREPIVLPQGVEVSIQNNEIIVKGPKGSLTQKLTSEVVIDINGNEVFVRAAPHVVDRPSRMQGLFWALISNMVRGVHTGFEKRLEMIGVGFKAAIQGSVLDLSIGVSHPTKIPIPKGLEVSVEKNTLISIKGIDKQLVGEFAAGIRTKRPPEPYKGKGIRYENEYVRRKAGKAAKTGKK
ncbi:50S ribosomal protein L6 [Chlamydia avium]|uniref:Large ribosomal subunit protein uL6 n=2 Tax=Chlamydia avium TaxID=1457141 RepID=W8JGV8_9CHLA|nr:50S ribosomal protein L6 [Chlamydia avium]AHK63756.1 50S ribosomal protein L6 [Chlamydia avium 10DC88]EPP36332.1 ribosomal protein L6 [Chlamydia psittaci 10_743_SC13]EPP38683.1 ribosomal protein L6 [Chlamydia avium]VVT43337.1 50S ribosomal protein L6 [Chlamydia avium]